MQLDGHLAWLQFDTSGSAGGIMSMQNAWAVSEDQNVLTVHETDSNTNREATLSVVFNCSS